MDPQVQASFIPKKSLEMGASPRGGGFGGLVFLIALLFFVASLVAAGASFAYTQYLQKAIVDKSDSLKKAEGAYNAKSIEDLARLDNRLIQSNALLNKHVAVSGIFSFLSTQTLVNVSFSNFTYELGGDGTAKITMAGAADSFSTVALQSDQFNGNKLLKDVLFSSITVGAGGRISFNVSAVVDPSILLYKNTIGTAATPAADASASAAVPAQTGSTTNAFPAN
jgi:hypothetical protein